MRTFCTIVTASHLPLAKALHASLQKYRPGIVLSVLVTDKNEISSEEGFSVLSVNDLKDQKFLKEIERKYAHSNPDHFRWALKPLFISYLLGKGNDKVIFADPDLFFVNDFEFLFNELDEASILLTPHWANLDPIQNEDSLFSILRGGLFNAGFIGANKKGKEAMDWWAGLCLYRMEKQKDLGLYDDQKYLDLLPVQFNGVSIIKHQGCNLASWNIDTCKRELIDGKLYINKIFAPIFIHFAKGTIINILNKNDALLKPYLDEYIQLLNKENFNLMENIDQMDPEQFSSAFYSVKHKLRLRTRFKRLLFKLAEKL